MTEAGDGDLRVLLTFVKERCTQPAWRWDKLLDAVPRRDLTRAMVDGIDSLLADLESDSENVVLTFARIWSTLATDTFRSKDEAADGVLPRLPAEHRPVLACARAIYRGEEDEPWRDVDGLRSHADYVLAQIRHVASEHRVGER
jgi:hypothetical protein